MSGKEIDRRSFLKVMGWSGAGAATLSGCDLPTTVTIEEGKETVVSYLMPEEYVIPGQGVWYASTCQQCSAACGVHGRVREGRLLKVEGNPSSPIGRGKLCNMGQASLQAHYNPDRLKKPLLRKGAELQEATWEEALKYIEERAGKKSGVQGNRAAWLTGNVSGHQAVLLQAHMDSFGSISHYVHELINTAVSGLANKDVLGEVQPVYHLDKAKAVLSLGADFLGASTSPVHFATQYASFREAPRGVLIQVEPSMSLTGANADLWIPARPGTEGVLAMGIANALIGQHGVSAANLPAGVKQAIDGYGIDRAADITGVPRTQIEAIAKTLKERAPSLVLTGASAEGHAHGYNIAAAALMLNVLLGNVGQTITSSGDPAFPQLAARAGNTRDLFAFAEGADKGAFDVVFMWGTNPVYTAPAFLNFEDKLSKVPVKVAFAMYRDETVAKADVVLPLSSPYESWGTHLAAYNSDEPTVAVQQPLMQPIYPDTKSVGDVLLALLKMREPNTYSAFNDYYAYLRKAFSELPATHKVGGSDDAMWVQSLQRALLAAKGTPKELSAKPVAVDFPAYEKDAAYPMHLAPAARLGMWDGRNANLPWLQEQPDQISKVVWGSWAELHPKTADRLGVKNGDYISVTSAQGSIEVPVYVYRGVHPDVVAVPIGQGHTDYGRYATGRGVNPLKVLSQVTDGKTGELALYATRVKVAKVEKKKPGINELMVRFGGSESQVGRKLVASVTADSFNRTEGA